ncbi:MAG: hypothetical protein WD492_12655 [Alkalispirochaeta sp.]
MGNQNIPFSDETWRKIQERAAKNGRSARQEVVRIIERMLETEEVYVTPEEKDALMRMRIADHDKRQAE